MNPINVSIARPAHKRRRGQALILVLMSLTMMLGFAGLSVDVGQLYAAYRELQVTTNAAALAGAQALPNASATTTATAYSAVSGGLNAHNNLTNVTMVPGYPALKCLTSLTIPCSAPANANAIAVKQQVAVPMAFMKLFGTSSLTITTSATAVMRGAAPVPYNVAVVIDSTASMNSNDNDSNCSSTRIACALQGVQVLLSGLTPCASNQAGCGSATKNPVDGGATVANSVDNVSLFTFPPVSASSASADYTCQGSPSVVPYTSPLPTTSLYQIVNFSSDFRTSDTTTSLNSGSNIVAAVGTSKNSGCMQAKGGDGTFYAQAIYQAQAALVAEQASHPNTQNALVILSDGDANATCGGTVKSGVCTSGNMAGASTTSGVYMSTVNQCHQAITAAQAAAAAGTRVYSVAYGAEATGCSTDSPSITPCSTMQQMASNASTFFSDYTATGGSSSCISAARPVSGLNQIFTDIVQDLTVARLIPDSTQ